MLSDSRETSFSLFEKFTLKVSVMHDSFKIGFLFQNELPVAALQGCFILCLFVLFEHKNSAYLYL